MSSTAEVRSRDAKPLVSEREYFTAQVLDLLDEKKANFDFDLAPSRLDVLGQIFALNEFEKKLVAVLWVCVYSPEIRNHLLRVDPAITQLSPLLLSRLLQTEPVYRLGSESPLVLWEMISEQEFADNSISLTIDPQIVSWLDGNGELDQWLVGRAEVLSPSFELKNWRLEQLTSDIATSLRESRSCRVFFDTADKELAQAHAAALASRLGMIVVSYDLEHLSPDVYHRFAIRIQRQSFLDRCIPWFGPSQHLFSHPSGIASFPLQFVQGSPGNATQNGDGKEWIVRFEALTNQDRRTIWQSALPATKRWPGKEVHDLVWRSHLSPSDIVAIGNKRPEDLRQVTDLIRELKRCDLDGLVQRVDSQFEWGDLVVPEDVEERLHDVVFEARERSWLWSKPGARRLFPHGRGLVALLSGPPGTGKTMAAQVIANELGMDLLRVDLSAVISKWVGETTQNLQKLLSANISQQAVLFFDEADSLFGKRIDEIKGANDRYVNMDSGYLMVALENFDGIVLMATNLVANIDPAFVRRIRHRVEFKKPDEIAREQIWLRVLQGVIEDDVVAGLTDDLARVARIEATGAQIKCAVLSSLFASRRSRSKLSIQLLGDMLCRELAKDGRGLSERELTKLLGEAL